MPIRINSQNDRFVNKCFLRENNRSYAYSPPKSVYPAAFVPLPSENTYVFVFCPGAVFVIYFTKAESLIYGIILKAFSNNLIVSAPGFKGSGSYGKGSMAAP